MVHIDDLLAADLARHLELGIRGGIPSPEFAAQLLRRLNQAIAAKPAGEEKAGPPHADAPAASSSPSYLERRRWRYWANGEPPAGSVTLPSTRGHR